MLALPTRSTVPGRGYDAVQVASLFASGEKGFATYDFSDFSRLYQDAEGTVPVTAVEQPVGRIVGINGVVATQATATARAKVSARVNFAVSSHNFNSWGLKGSVSLSYVALANPSPTGESGCYAVIADTQPNPHFIGDNTHTLSGPGTIRLRAKAYGLDSVALVNYAVTIGVRFNLTTQESFAYVGTTTGSSITPLADGWFLLSVSFSDIAGVTIRIGDANNFSVIGDNAKGMLIDGVEFVPAGVTRYQRVNTPTDYDTVGFPHYLQFDGVDDFYATPSIDFTGTDKMTVWAGVEKLLGTDAGRIVELGAGASSMPGTFSLQTGAGGAAAYRVENFGASRSVSDAAPFPNGVSQYVSLSLDTSQALQADQTKVRILGAEIVTLKVVGPTVAANYTAKPLYIGANVAANRLFNGKIYSLIVRGTATPLPQIEAIESIIKKKMQLP